MPGPSGVAPTKEEEVIVIEDKDEVFQSPPRTTDTGASPNFREAPRRSVRTSARRKAAASPERKTTRTSVKKRRRTTSMASVHSRDGESAEKQDSQGQEPLPSPFEAAILLSLIHI